MANTAALLLPTPKLSAQGVVGSGAITGTVALTLRKPTLAVTAVLQVQSVVLALPTPTLVIKGSTANVGTVALVLPAPTLVGVGRTTNTGTVALVMPMPQLAVAGSNTVKLALPAPQLAVVGTTGVIGNVQLVLPAPALTLTAKVTAAATAILRLPVPVLTIEGQVGNIGTVALALRGIALAAAGNTGVVGTCKLTLPITGALSAAGYRPAVGTVTLTLPLLILQATGSSGAVAPPDSAALPAFVMHTESGAISQYVNYAFNSFATFNSVSLGANAEGLFVIASGEKDNGAAIQAAARVGITDFGTSFLKRIDRCYVGYRADGDMTIRVYTDEVNVRDYLLTAYGKSGIHGNHSRIGKGLAARYWQFELRNNNGAGFELNALEVKPTQLRRRIGGGDA